MQERVLQSARQSCSTRQARLRSATYKMPGAVELTAGNAKCLICPEVGGSIAAWTVGNQDLLRRADNRDLKAADPLAMSSFPLVPYSNRIGYGRFDWAHERVDIEPNFPPEPHAIHGVGWKRPWEVSEKSDRRCVLKLTHNADKHWPWSFCATQEIVLGETTLELTLLATNRSDKAVPLAFGHHPYFDKDGASISFHADQMLLVGDDSLPTVAVPPVGKFDFSRGESVEGREIDHCYTGWDGTARIIWRDRRLELTITSDMQNAVVYIPTEGSAFCFEPVPHVNNALNRPGDHPAMPVVKPGDVYKSVIRMEASDMPQTDESATAATSNLDI